VTRALAASFSAGFLTMANHESQAQTAENNRATSRRHQKNVRPVAEGVRCEKCARRAVVILQSNCAQKKHKVYTRKTQKNQNKNTKKTQTGHKKNTKATHQNHKINTKQT
jgi:cytochrome c-type biogenesis protein CcmH/NrfF